MQTPGVGFLLRQHMCVLSRGTGRSFQNNLTCVSKLCVGTPGEVRERTMACCMPLATVGQPSFQHGLCPQRCASWKHARLLLGQQGLAIAGLLVNITMR